MKKQIVKSQKNFKDFYKEIRKTWGAFDPATKIIEGKKQYNRAREKNLLKKEYQKYLFY
jgi:hypothetical protein